MTTTLQTPTDSLSNDETINGDVSTEENQESLSILRSKGLIQRHVDSYRSLAMARSACYEHSVKPRRIIMGDCPWHWVVSPADAERLLRAGYELAV